MIRVLTKQLELIEIELADYQIAKNQGFVPIRSEEYYAGLAHAYKGIKFALNSLYKTQQNGETYVVH